MSATFCDECQEIVSALEELVDAVPRMAQAALQINTLRRLRRVDQVVEELVCRRMLAALINRAGWDDVADALGMSPEEAKAKYPLPNSRPNWGWGS